MTVLNAHPAKMMGVFGSHSFDKSYVSDGLTFKDEERDK